MILIYRGIELSLPTMQFLHSDRSLGNVGWGDVISNALMWSWLMVNG